MGFELRANEQILADVAANLTRGVEAVGGRIRITDLRVLFEANALNLQTMSAEIPLSQIAEVRPRNTLFVVPNGLLIKLKSGVEYKFVTWNRSQLMALLQGRSAPTPRQ